MLAGVKLYPFGDSNYHNIPIEMLFLYAHTHNTTGTEYSI